MDRREFLKVVGVAVTAAGVGHEVYAGATAARKPNIILIMADDIGVECFSQYGSTSYNTPNLDKLAKSSIRFDHCYSQPLCTPSRVKIMTGQSNIRNYSNFSILEKDQMTFGHVLQRAGYKTAVAGKWQLYGAEHYGKLAGTGTHPCDAGFDQYCLWQIDKLGSRYWNPLIEEDGKVLEGMKDKYGPDVCCEFIERFIEENKGRPFFVYYPMMLVHDPFVPTPASKDRKCKDKQQNFADMVEYMDAIIGRVLAKLDELKLRENTLVLFTGDNGTHGSIASKVRGETVRGAKGKTTNAGTHVPLIVNFEGVTGKNKVCNDLVDFSDFMPTLTEVADGKLPENVTLDGISFAPQIFGKGGEKRRWIYCYYNPRPGNARFSEQRFARDKRFKLYGDGRFYDVQKDPKENKPIPKGIKEKHASTARAKLQRALDSMPQEPLRIKESSRK